MLVIYGDHGIPYGPVYKTPRGKYEHGLPVLRIIMSKELLTKNELTTMRHNENMLTTHYDTFATVRDVVRHAVGDIAYNAVAVKPSWPMPGVSLMRTRLKNSRSCKEAFVPNNMCRCKPRVVIDLVRQQSLVAKLVTDIISWLVKRFEGNNADSTKCHPWEHSTASWTIDSASVPSDSDISKTMWSFDAITSLRLTTRITFSGTWDPITRSVMTLARDSPYDNVETCGISKSVQEFCLCLDT